jgi:hypothetical protein
MDTGLAVERRHRAGASQSRALWSPCGAYRFRLDRTWDGASERLLWIMLNPSRATEVRNDPTVERCERRARAMGFGGFSVVNLFGFCATDPADLRRAADPVGAGNDAAIDEAAGDAALVLCGWGVHGAHMGRGPEVAGRLAAAGRPLAHLGLTRDGHPRHPLYVAYSVTPRRWVPPASQEVAP